MIVGAANFDRQPGGSPFRQTFLQSPCLEATGTQKSDCLKRKDAVCAPAVGHDFMIGIDFGKSFFQCAHGTIHRSRHMAQGTLVWRADVLNGHSALTDQFAQLFASNRF